MEKIHEHLLGRPIAPIFRASNEKENEVALKIMTIIDYYIEKRGLNTAIDAVPKLRDQLLRWSSFASFRFYIYSAPAGWFKDDEMLQCKRCEFIGPYLQVLSHMAVNHDLHIGLKKCAWCNRVDYQAHLYQGTSSECYEMYLAKEQLHGRTYPQVVVEFYEMLKSIGSALDVKINRSETFAGIGYQSKDYLLDVDAEGDVDQAIVVFSSKRKHRKEINATQLNRSFRQAIEHFHGANAQKYIVGSQSNDGSLGNLAGSDARPFRAKKTSPTASTHTQGPSSAPQQTYSQQSQVVNPQPPPGSTSHAFGSYVATEIEIMSPEMMRNAKRRILEVVAICQEEDRIKEDKMKKNRTN